MNRKAIKEKELEFLAGEFKKNPDFFKRESYIDNSDFLEKIGIFLPEKISKNASLGYLKLWPQDFIVEEVGKDGKIQTVQAGNFFKENLSDEKTTYATLVKCGLSTIEAMEEISSLLNADRKKIQFAGIKDKDALTSQLISFRDVGVEEIKKISSPYFFLKDVYCGKGTVETGGLNGNKFTILVRTDSSFQENKFLENKSFIERNGFFNFFYSQRFGSPRFINWFWGLLILKGDYERAVMSFLCSEGQRETLYFKKIRREIKEDFGDWQKIGRMVETFPLIMQNEIKIVDYLKNNPSDFAEALNQIPEQIQLWIYAYSTLLFNRKISEFLSQGKDLPEKFPLILSRDKRDWLEYGDFLDEDGISSLPIENLKPFQFIQWKKRMIKTKEKAEIHIVKLVPEGVILCFSLPKSCYATTLLTHLFNLASGAPPSNIPTEQVDTKEKLNEQSLSDTLENFKGIIHSKNENLFEKNE